MKSLKLDNTKRIEALNAVFENQIQTLESDIEALSPHDRLNFLFGKLLPHVLPKVKDVEQHINIQPPNVIFYPADMSISVSDEDIHENM